MQKHTVATISYVGLHIIPKSN